VSCKTCPSENQRDSPAELTVCFDNLQTTLNNTHPVEIISQSIRVCLECGFSELVIPQAALLLLKQARRRRVRLVTIPLTDSVEFRSAEQAK
jgi:hypothetical protein